MLPWWLDSAALNQWLNTFPVDTVRWVLVSFVITTWAVASSVSLLNVKNLDAPLDPLVPKLYGANVLKKYEKHKDYIRASNNFKEFSTAFSQIISFIFWFGGCYPLLNTWVMKTFPNYSAAIWGTLFTLIITFATSLISLPLGYYQNFVLEEKFGFNRMTIKTWIKDTVKGWALMGVLGGILMYCMFWILTNYPVQTYWWLLVLLFVGFQMIMMVLQPWIMKLFLEFITIEKGIAFAVRGKAKQKYLKNRYFYPVFTEGQDRELVENEWTTRDSQFKGEKKGACLLLKKNSEGNWVMLEKANDIVYCTSENICTSPEQVKSWILSDEVKKEEIEEEQKKKEKEDRELEDPTMRKERQALIKKEKEDEELLEEDEKRPMWVKKIDMTDLKSKLEHMADEHKFKFAAVYIIDGSTRSEHSNAFFMGFAWFRKICLFDTLLKNLSVPSICGVMGHEMGHCVMKHIPKQTVFSAGVTSVSMFLISLILYNKTLHQTFYMDASKPENLTPWVGIIVVELALTPIFFWVGLLSKYITRKYEYEADEFAVKSFKKNYAQDLVDGLKGLYKENKAHLNPHPLFVLMNHSHPTLIQRVKWISDLSIQREGKDIIKLDA